MKAIRVHEFGGPEVLRMEDVPEPKPGPRQVVIAVNAVGVNPVDTYIRSGTWAMKPTLPYTPGNDAAGIVESVGSEVERFKPGDRVYIGGTSTGAYAERALSEEWQVHPLPENVSFSQGAGVNTPYVTAYRAMFEITRATPDQILFVHGASGGVGIAGVQLGRASGMTVIGTAGTDRGRTLVQKQGAHVVLDHTSADCADQVLAATEGRGADLILEMLANVNLAKDLQMVAKYGTIIVVGNRGTIEINPRDAMGKDATIQGMTILNATAEELRRIHNGLYAGLENGSLRPIVGRQVNLAEASVAHEAVVVPGSYGKLVLVPR